MKPSTAKARVAIVMGSDSDLPVMAAAAEFLDSLELPYELQVVSAHRTPDYMSQFAHDARANGLQIIIAGAGGAAHLPGMIAAMTSLPVIGVPVRSSHLQGLDSLLSIVQMPAGIPVATMAINGAKNAAILACRIVALADSKLAERLETWMAGETASVLEKSQQLATLGYQAYLKSTAE